jgi:hypothetical protein
VVENQRHATSVPDFVLSAKLAERKFDARLVEALFEMAALVARPLDEDLLEGGARSP